MTVSNTFLRLTSEGKEFLELSNLSNFKTLALILNEKKSKQKQRMIRNDYSTTNAQIISKLAIPLQPTSAPRPTELLFVVESVTEGTVADESSEDGRAV